MCFVLFNVIFATPVTAVNRAPACTINGIFGLF